jgi:hypothetical protein
MTSAYNGKLLLDAVKTKKSSDEIENLLKQGSSLIADDEVRFLMR